MKTKRVSKGAVKTTAERIEALLSIYERVNAETNRLIERYVDEVLVPRTPGIPRAVLRGLEFDNRFSHGLNYAEALRYLQHAPGRGQ